MATFADIDSWFPNSGTASPANLRTAIKDATGSAAVIQTFHAAADATAALTALGGTTTGRAVFTAADAAAARTAISAAAAGATVDLRTGSVSLAASAFPGAQIFTITTASTLTLPARSAVTTGTELRIVNVAGSTAALTVSRAGSDTIDGATSVVIYPGEAFTLVAGAGTAWHSVNFPTGLRLLRRVVTSSLPPTVDLALPTEFSQFELRFVNLNASTAANVRLRVSVDGGTNYLFGASDYQTTQIANNPSTPIAVTANEASVNLGIGSVSGAATDAAMGTVHLRPGGASAGAAGLIDSMNRQTATHLQRQASGFLVLASTTRATHIRVFTSAGTLADNCNLQLYGFA